MSTALEDGKRKLSEGTPFFSLNDLPQDRNANIWSRIESTYKLTLPELSALQNFSATASNSALLERLLAAKKQKIGSYEFNSFENSAAPLADLIDGNALISMVQDPDNRSFLTAKLKDSSKAISSDRFNKLMAKCNENDKHAFQLQDGQIYCLVCEKVVRDDNFKDHCVTKKHISTIEKFLSGGSV